MKNKNDYAGALELINKDEMVDRTLDQAIDGNLEVVKKALKIAQAIEEKRLLLVPVEATESLCIVGTDEWNEKIEQGCVFKRSFCHHIYKAMTQAVDTEKLIEEVCGE